MTTRRRGTGAVMRIAAAMKPFMSAVPRPYKSSPTVVSEYGSVAHPVPAGTTSVCPDSISPPARLGPNEASRLARPSPPSSTVARPPLDSMWSATQWISDSSASCSRSGRPPDLTGDRQFVASLIDDCGCWHGFTV